MIVDIGLIVATYAVVRLLWGMRPPAPGQWAPPFICVISVLACALIALCVVDLVLNSAASTASLARLKL